MSKKLRKILNKRAFFVTWQTYSPASSSVISLITRVLTPCCLLTLILGSAASTMCPVASTENPLLQTMWRSPATRWWSDETTIRIQFKHNLSSNYRGGSPCSGTELFPPLACWSALVQTWSLALQGCSWWLVCLEQNVFDFVVDYYNKWN